MIDILFTWRRLHKQVEELKAELISNETLRVRLTHDLNSVNSELDALLEAFHQSEKAREKAITERENMKRQRDEWHVACNDEEIRSAEWQGKYQRLESAMKSALGIQS